MPHKTRIKICGLTNAEDVRLTVDAGADALGFVFYPPSPRYVSAEQVADLLKSVPPFIVSTGLFVNAELEEMAGIVMRAGVQLLQFHGDETPDWCAQAAARVGRPFIKVFRVKPDTRGADLLECEAAYRQASPLFQGLLLDTYVDAYGGSGKVFDWSLIPKELAPRVVLSGGLSILNVAGALELVRPFALDVSSGVERAKGLKDATKVREFISIVRLVSH